MKKLLAVFLVMICCLIVSAAYAEAEMPEGHTLTLLGEFNFSTMTKKPDLVGLEDDNGKTVIKPQFDAMNSLGGGWWTAEKGGKVGLANTLGKVVLKPTYDSIERNADGTFTTVSGDARGLLSTSGKEIIRPGTMNFSLLDNGVYLVEQKEKLGLLTTDGKTLVKPAYESIEPQEDGSYFVGSKGLFGIVSESGKVICKPAYESIFLYQGMYVAASGDSYVILDEAGKRLDKVASTVRFGRYEQDGDQLNGAEPIEWIVLDQNDNCLMLISAKALTFMGYESSEGKDGVSWEDSSVRAWLNGDFYETAFSGAEKQRIVEAFADNRSCLLSKSSNEYSPDGKNTIDRIYLLSYPEVQEYFSKEKDRCCKATEYALDSSGSGQDRENCSWWLRTPGQDSGTAVSITDTGASSADSCSAANGIRPVMWVNRSLMQSGELIQAEGVLISQIFYGYDPEKVIESANEGAAGYETLAFIPYGPEGVTGVTFYRWYDSIPSQEEIERDTQMAVKVWRDYPFLYEEGGMIFGVEVSGSIPVRPDDVGKTKYCLMVGQDKTGECVGYAIVKIHIG